MIAGAPSPLVAVGAAIIDFAPPGSKELMVSLFGTNDKVALMVIVGAAVLAFGALLGPARPALDPRGRARASSC